MTRTSPKDLTPELQAFAEVVQWERCDQQVASALKRLTAEERTCMRKSFSRLAAFIQFLEPQGLETESGRRAFETLHRDLLQQEVNKKYNLTPIPTKSQEDN